MNHLLVFTLALIGSAQCVPVLTGYDRFLNMTGKLESQSSPVLVDDYFAIYYNDIDVNNMTRIGIVCETEYWCAFGLSYDGTMIGYNTNTNSYVASDATICVVGSDNATLEATDFYLLGRFPPAQCTTQHNQAVCTDVSVTGCVNNVSPIRAYRVGNFSVMEFNRSINADACDIPIIPGEPNYLIIGHGPSTTGTYPNTIIEHTARSQGTQNDLITFYYANITATTSSTTTSSTTTSSTTTSSTTAATTSSTTAASTTAATTSSTTAATTSSTTGATTSSTSGTTTTTTSTGTPVATTSNANTFKYSFVMIAMVIVALLF